MLPAVPDSCSVTGLKTVMNYEKTEVDRPQKTDLVVCSSGLVVIRATCSSHPSCTSLKRENLQP